MDSLDSIVKTLVGESDGKYYMVLKSGKLIEIPYNEYWDINNTNNRLLNKFQKERNLRTL